MANVEPVNFKANAGIKDIVGRGLIYDDNIAIIELVKNSRDADASKAEIEFIQETKISNNSSIVVSDDGDGMTLEDIKNKWLNIAYSDKRLSTSKKAKSFAGDKGIGRFSCDRLGKELVLYTKSRNSSGGYLKVPIRWKLFENKQQDEEISSVSLQCHVLDREQFVKEIDNPSFEHGTVLQIQKLRDEWDEKKLKKLFSEIGKFSSDIDSKFEVYVYSDTKYKDDLLTNKINKKIDSDIFNNLSFKTTYIKSSIDKTGKKISTSLYYQGEEVFRYTAKNFYASLKDIEIEIHYLDTLSKAYFTKNVGIKPNDYGSVFLFYNGFRVSPYGNAKNDWLGLDQRKSQGTARYLGTREVFGRIDIRDLDKTFSVITSREGLVRSRSFRELIAFDKDEKALLSNKKEGYGYATVIIRQIEHFVVSGLDWNRLIVNFDPEGKEVMDEGDIQRDPKNYGLREISPQSVKEACDRILKTPEIEVESFKINKQLIEKIKDISDKKYQQFVNDFIKKTEGKDIAELPSRHKGQIKQIIRKERARTQEAKQAQKYAEKKRREAEKRTEEKVSENLFLRSTVSQDISNVVSLHHHIGISADTIENHIRNFTRKIQSSKTVKKSLVLEMLEKISHQSRKISSTTRFATKANFNLQSTKMRNDICNYISEYLVNVCSGMFKVVDKKVDIRFVWLNKNNIQFITDFRPLEISIILDNLISNSRKAHSKEIKIEVLESDKDILRLLYSDDGNGIQPSKSSKIFDFGFTTTDGAGLGMNQIQYILSQIGGSISLVPSKKGTSFQLEIKK
ncbi:MAG: ATP-binding protein [Thermodesulfobacteriota bacterium]